VTETPDQSDQLPEEAPAEQVPDDDGSAQESAEKQAGRQSDDDGGEQGQATGNRKSAG
jgi:hypothetical protein